MQISSIFVQKIIIVRTESLTFASIFAQISSIFVMILMLQTRSRRTTPRTVTYSGRSFWSFSTKLVLLLLLDLNQYATVFNSEHARTIFYWFCTHLSHVEIWYAQFDNLNIRDNISDENTRRNVLRMSVTLVEIELEPKQIALVKSLLRSCNYSGMIRVSDHTSAACFRSKLMVTQAVHPNHKAS